MGEPKKRQKNRTRRSKPANAGPPKYLVDITGLPHHLVLWYLWWYARPDVAAVNNDEPIRSAVDMLRLLRTSKKDKSFSYLDGRPIQLRLYRSSFNSRYYDSRNGISAAVVIQTLRSNLDTLAKHPGSDFKVAVAALTLSVPPTLKPEVERAESKAHYLTRKYLDGLNAS